MYDYTRWRTQAQGRVAADGGTTAPPATVFGCSVTKNAGNGSYRIRVFFIPALPPPPPQPGPPADPMIPFPSDSLLQGQGQEIPASRLLAMVMPIGATPRTWSINDVNDSEKDIFIATDLGVLVDNEFCFTLGYFLPA